MKTENSIALALQYSDDAPTLAALIARLNITASSPVVIPTPWNDGLQALLYVVTVEGYTFNYYGSHNDAQTMKAAPNIRDTKAHREATKKRVDGLLYSLLCCFSCDLSLLHSDPEDLGFDSDSIKEMAKYNEAKEHARKLSAALKLSQAELASLPA